MKTIKVWVPVHPLEVATVVSVVAISDAVPVGSLPDELPSEYPSLD